MIHNWDVRRVVSSLALIDIEKPYKSVCEREETQCAFPIPTEYRHAISPPKSCFKPNVLRFDLNVPPTLRYLSEKPDRVTS